GLQPYQYGTDTSTASMAHWLGILVGFLAPLIIMLTRGQQDPNVRANAVESLNFQLTMLVGYIVSFILTFAFIGVIGFMVLPILGLIFPILGAIAANRGEAYRYPVRIPFVK
ncbi:MAG: DUF4870 domain-containing protein, partial [Propionicimonas sp.]|nr:DUF4870 domain-containing protein [Propionicimonas sp.]